MKIRDLIEELQGLDPEIEVMIKTWDYDYYEYDYSDLEFDLIETKILASSEDGEVYVPSDESTGKETRVLGIRGR